MICPCYECTRRTAVPNCHATCEPYKEFAEYRQKIRDARLLERQGDDAKIRTIFKRKRDEFKSRRR